MIIKVNKKTISHNTKPFIVAEVSANHKNSLKNTYKLLRAAAEAKVDAVKFQTFNLDDMTLNLNKREFLIKKKFKTKSWNNRTLHSIYKEAHFPYKWHKKVFNEAKRLGLIVFSSVFDEKSLIFLEKLKVPMYKIASLESLHFPLIEKVVKTKKPIIISTGTLSIHEIKELIQFLKKIKCKKFIILHCVTEYPANYRNINLKTIKHLKKKFNCLVGYSDHTKGIGVSVSSITYGACLIGQVKNDISKSEKVYKKYRRSIYSIKDIKKGEKLSEKNIGVIRPGLGMEPKYFLNILNKKAKNFIKKGTPIKLRIISN